MVCRRFFQFAAIRRREVRRLNRFDELNVRFDFSVCDDFGGKRPRRNPSSRVSRIPTVIHGFGLSFTKAPRKKFNRTSQERASLSAFQQRREYFSGAAGTELPNLVTLVAGEELSTWAVPRLVTSNYR
jgi:hypothetical protein